MGQLLLFLLFVSLTFAENTAFDQFRRVTNLQVYRTDYERLGCEVERQFVHGDASFYIPPMTKVEYSLIRCPFSIGDGTVMITSSDSDDDDGESFTYSSHYLPDRFMLTIMNDTQMIPEGYSLHRLTRDTWILDAHGKAVYVTSSTNSLYELRTEENRLIVNGVKSYQKIGIHFDALC